MNKTYRHDVLKFMDEDATTNLIVEGIYDHCSRCNNFIPEINNDPCYFFDKNEKINPNKYIIRCTHYTACLETLNREDTNKEG